MKRTVLSWLIAIVRRTTLAVLVAGVLGPGLPAVAGPEHPPVCPYLRNC